MIPLDANPVLRPIGVGELLRRTAGEAVTKAAGSLQRSAGQDAGAQAAIHAMRDIFDDAD